MSAPFYGYLAGFLRAGVISFLIFAIIFIAPWGLSPVPGDAPPDTSYADILSSRLNAEELTALESEGITVYINPSPRYMDEGRRVNGWYDPWRKRIDLYPPAPGITPADVVWHELGHLICDSRGIETGDPEGWADAYAASRAPGGLGYPNVVTMVEVNVSLESH